MFHKVKKLQNGQFWAAKYFKAAHFGSEVRRSPALHCFPLLLFQVPSFFQPRIFSAPRNTVSQRRHHYHHQQQWQWQQQQQQWLPPGLNISTRRHDCQQLGTRLYQSARHTADVLQAGPIAGTRGSLSVSVRLITVDRWTRRRKKELRSATSD